MAIFDPNDEQSVAAYVTACGVQPNRNYLVMQRRASSWVLMANMFTGNDYESTDSKMARIERYYILIFTPKNLYLQEMTADQGTAAQIIPLVLVRQFSLPVVSGQLCLRFNLDGKWQNYYCNTAQTEDRGYILRNFKVLSNNGFYGLLKGAKAKTAQQGARQQTAPRPDPQPYAPSKPAPAAPARSRKPKPQPAPKTIKQPAQQFHEETQPLHTPVAKADHIPAEGRPERPYVSPWGRLFGGRKRD